MKSTESACQQTTELTRYFKAHLPHLRTDTIQRFIDLMMAMITAQSVNFYDLSANMPGESSPEAKKQRVKRTLADEQLTLQVFLCLLVAHLPPGKILMSLDRTTWKHGTTPVNYLVLGAVVAGFTIPLVWVALDHTGNSHTYARMWVVLHLLKALPAKRWRGLVADREFIGAEWFRFLRRFGIRRAVRIKQDAYLDDLRAEQRLADLAIGAFREIGERVCVYGECMRVVATRSPNGDLVIIATDFSVHETWKLYRLRWSIECTFSSFKERGFDLERTGITDPKRLERLFGLVTLAWMCCLRLGVWLDEVQPITILKHGRKAVSYVRHGVQHLRDALRWKPKQLSSFLQQIILPFPAPGTA